MEGYKKSGETLLILDAGSTLFKELKIHDPFLIEAKHRAALILKSYKVMNTAAMTVGMEDFAFGAEYLEKAKKDYGFLTSANIYKNGKPFLKPYILVTVKGERVGIFGLTELLTGNEKIGVNIKSPETVSKEIVQRLKENGCDVIVLLSQLKEETLRKVVNENKDINFVINGRDSSGSEIRKIGTVPVLSVRSQGKYLGKLKVKLTDEKAQLKEQKLSGSSQQAGRRILIFEQPSFITVSTSIPDEAKIAKLLKEYEKNLAKEKYKSMPGNKKGENGLFYVGQAVCIRCHVKQFDFVAATKHSQAYRAIDSKENSKKSSCVSCHTTGFGKPGGFVELPAPFELRDVQCEICHGPGSLHFRKGNITRTPSESLCFKCHTKEQSPNFNPKSVWSKIKCPK